MTTTEIYTTYTPETDMTFIMKDIYKNGEIISTEVKGFYYGGATEENTEEFYGKLKAEY